MNQTLWDWINLNKHNFCQGRSTSILCTAIISLVSIRFFHCKPKMALSYLVDTKDWPSESLQSTLPKGRDAWRANVLPKCPESKLLKVVNYNMDQKLHFHFTTQDISRVCVPTKAPRGLLLTWAIHKFLN